MIERLDLSRPIYKETARYGHFGWDRPGYTWERLDFVDVLRKEAGL
jgi:S-adenosylmethionine synthetase